MRQLYRKTLTRKISIKLHASLLKSHFNMGVILSICCMFSKHLFFIIAHLQGCFQIQRDLGGLSYLLAHNEIHLFLILIIKHLFERKKTNLTSKLFDEKLYTNYYIKLCLLEIKVRLFYVKNIIATTCTNATDQLTANNHK